MNTSAIFANGQLNTESGVSDRFFTAGQIIGLVLHFSPEAWHQAAQDPKLNPNYQRCVRAIARFREDLDASREEVH